MSEFKERKVISEFIKFELDTTELDPPEIELRISPLDSIQSLDGFNVAGQVKPFSEIILGKAMACVQEWNLKQNGKELLIADLEIKERVLRRLLGEKLKGKKILLGNEIITYASNRENFLKN